MKKVQATSVGSQTLFKLLDLIPWFSTLLLCWIKSSLYLQVDAFCVGMEEPRSSHLSTAVLLSLEHGGSSSSYGLMFFIYMYLCAVCRGGIRMRRCKTQASYETSLTKSPKHPGKGKIHLDKVTDKKFINLVCNSFFVIDTWLKLLQEGGIPFPQDLSAICTEIGKNTSFVSPCI